MSISARIEPFLPYLRRYARALAGSQSSGDAYVAAMLEALIANVSIFPDASSEKVSLYKLLTALFDSASVEVKPLQSPFAWEQRAFDNMSALRIPARQAFLLASVEGFDMSETAEILGVDEAKAADLLDEAAARISLQIETDVLIIEDEPLIAMDIEQLVEDLGHSVVAIARTRSEAIEAFSAANPGLVLADIQLADGSSGIDTVNEMLKTSAVPVIFITAFPERLLTGERPEPTFLVTKPYTPQMVKALISQALFFNESAKKAA